MDKRRPQTSLGNHRKSNSNINSSQKTMYNTPKYPSRPSRLGKTNSTCSYCEDIKDTHKVSNCSPNKSFKFPSRPKVNGRLTLMNKYHISLASFIVNHKASIRFQGTKRFRDKTGEYYLNNVQLLKNPEYDEEDSIMSQLSLKEPTNLLDCNSKCKGLKPLANKAKKIMAILPENSLTPIPLTVVAKDEISKLEKKELENAERTAVHIRRLQYSSEQYNKNMKDAQNNALAIKVLNAIILIQEWWKSMYAIIKIQKYIRGWLVRRGVEPMILKKHEENERIMQGQRILNLVLLRKGVDFVFPNEFIGRRLRLLPNDLLTKLRKYFNRWKMNYGRIIINPQQLEYQRLLVKLINARYENITARAIDLLEKPFKRPYFNHLKNLFHKNGLIKYLNHWRRFTTQRGNIDYIIATLINSNERKRRNSVPYKKHSGICPVTVPVTDYTFANSNCSQFYLDDPKAKLYVYKHRDLDSFDNGTNELDYYANKIQYDATLSPINKIEDDSISHSINNDKFIILGMKKYYLEHWNDLCWRHKLLRILRYALIKRMKMLDQYNYLKDVYNNCNNNTEENYHRQFRRNRSSSPNLKVNHEDNNAKKHNRVSFDIVGKNIETCTPIVYSSQSFYLQKDQQIDLNQDGAKLQSDYTSLFTETNSPVKQSCASPIGLSINKDCMVNSKNHDRIQVIKATVPIEEETTKEKTVTKCLSDIDLLNKNTKENKDKYRQYMFPLNDENIRQQLNVNKQDQVKRITLIQSDLDNNANANANINFTTNNNNISNLNYSTIPIYNTHTHRRSNSYTGTIDYSPNRSTINRNISLYSENKQAEYEMATNHLYPLKEINTSQFYHTPVKEQSPLKVNPINTTFNNSQVGIYVNYSKCSRRGKKPVFNNKKDKEKDNTINNNLSQNNTNLSVSFLSNSQGIQIYPSERNNNSSKNFKYLWKNSKHYSHNESLNESKENMPNTMTLSRYDTEFINNNNNSIRLTRQGYVGSNGTNMNNYEVNLCNSNCMYMTNTHQSVKSTKSIFDRPIGRVFKEMIPIEARNPNPLAMSIDRSYYRTGSCPRTINSKTIHFKLNHDNDDTTMIKRMKTCGDIYEGSSLIKRFIVQNYRKLWTNELMTVAMAYRKRDNLFYLIKATFFYLRGNDRNKAKEVINNWLIETIDSKISARSNANSNRNEGSGSKDGIRQQREMFC